MKWTIPALVMLTLLVWHPQRADAQQTQPATHAAAPTAASKVENAVSAGPEEITAGATVLDWPASADSAPAVLRQGTNGWTCFPDVPGTPRNDPMCFDETWMQWAGAWMSRTAPQINKVGISYMLQGSADASNSDPFATEPAPGQSWVITGPHVMILVPDAQLLAGMSTDPNNGGPYVMWAGTPYAHIMLPTK